MRMVLLGPPGSDKGEYAVKLAEKYDLVLLTIANMLSNAVEKRLEVGIQAQAYLEHGQYIPDDLLLDVIRDRMAQPDVKSGFILVGFPRSTAQADSLDELLEGCGMALDLALHLNVEDEILLERLEGRRTCISCGMRYNIFTNPPMVHGVCDMCGGRVGRGADSNEVVISNRLRAYEQQIHSLVSYYLLHDKLREVDGGGSTKEVSNLLNQAIDDWTRSQAEMTQALMDKVEQVAEAAGQEIQANIEQDGGDDVVVPEPVAKADTAEKKAPAKKGAVGKKVPAKKKSTVKKKPTAKKKVAPKKAQPQKKVTVKKKTATKKKVTTKKKAIAKKKVTTKKKAAVKGRVAPKKKVQSKKKSAVKKAGSIKKKAVNKKAQTKKKTAIKNKAVIKKKTTPKKKPPTKKKDSARKGKKR